MAAMRALCALLLLQLVAGASCVTWVAWSPSGYMGNSPYLVSGRAFGPEPCTVTSGAQRNLLDHTRLPNQKGGDTSGADYLTKSKPLGQPVTAELQIVISNTQKAHMVYHPAQGPTQPLRAIVFSASSIWTMAVNPRLPWAEKLAKDFRKQHGLPVTCYMFELRADPRTSPGPFHIFTVCTTSKNVDDEMKYLSDLIVEQSQPQKQRLMAGKNKAANTLDYTFTGDDGPMSDFTGDGFLIACIAPTYGKPKPKPVAILGRSYRARTGPRLPLAPLDDKPQQVQWTGYEKGSDVIAVAKVYDDADAEDPGAIMISFRGTANWNDVKLDLNLMQRTFFERLSTYMQGKPMLSLFSIALLKLAQRKNLAADGNSFINFFREWYQFSLKPLLDDVDPNTPVYLCGASLGGYLAQLLSMQLTLSGRPGLVACRTMAAPGAVRAYIERGREFFGNDVVPPLRWARAMGRSVFVNHVSLFDWIPKIGVQPGKVCIYADEPERPKCGGMAVFNIEGITDIYSCWDQHIKAISGLSRRKGSKCCPLKVPNERVCGFVDRPKLWAGPQGKYSPYWFSDLLGRKTAANAVGQATDTGKRLGLWTDGGGGAGEGSGGDGEWTDSEEEGAEESAEQGAGAGAGDRDASNIVVLLDDYASRQWALMTADDGDFGDLFGGGNGNGKGTKLGKPPNREDGFSNRQGGGPNRQGGGPNRQGGKQGGSPNKWKVDTDEEGGEGNEGPDDDGNAVPVRGDTSEGPDNDGDLFEYVFRTLPPPREIPVPVPGQGLGDMTDAEANRMLTQSVLPGLGQNGGGPGNGGNNGGQDGGNQGTGGQNNQNNGGRGGGGGGTGGRSRSDARTKPKPDANTGGRSQSTGGRPNNNQPLAPTQQDDGGNGDAPGDDNPPPRTGGSGGGRSRASGMSGGSGRSASDAGQGTGNRPQGGQRNRGGSAPGPVRGGDDE